MKNELKIFVSLAYTVVFLVFVGFANLHSHATEPELNGAAANTCAGEQRLSGVEKRSALCD